MARAARDARRQVARAGLLAALTAACAVVQEPPGGPPDFAAPMVVGVRPDSGAILPRYDDAALIRFDEVISEQSGGGLDRLIQLSPRADELEVKWKRKALEVKPRGGWRDSVVYHLTLLPGVADLRNNRMEAGRTVIFSTGGPIPETRISGTILDWEGGRAARNGIVEAVFLPDSLVYVTGTDAAGEFALATVPQGTYVVFGVVDANGNRRRDRREPFDSARIVLDSVASAVFWSFTHDTVGPQLRRVVPVDSVTLRLEFNQRVAPDAPAPDVQAWALPDTIPVPLAAVWRPATYDSVRAAEQPRDTMPPAPADTAAARAAPRRAAPAPGGPARQAADTSRAAQLLRERPTLSDQLFVRFVQSLAPGARYLIEARARNLTGAEASSRSAVAVPEAREPP